MFGSKYGVYLKQGGRLPHHIATCLPPRFSDFPTALIFNILRKVLVLRYFRFGEKICLIQISSFVLCTLFLSLLIGEFCFTEIHVMQEHELM